MISCEPVTYEPGPGPGPGIPPKAEPLTSAQTARPLPSNGPPALVAGPGFVSAPASPLNSDSDTWPASLGPGRQIGLIRIAAHTGRNRPILE